MTMKDVYLPNYYRVDKEKEKSSETSSSITLFETRYVIRETVNSKYLRVIPRYCSIILHTYKSGFTNFN